MKKRQKAFSLIELSIVILIIGILVAGVTQGSRLLQRMSLNSARSQTISSPVVSIQNIIGWWETTLEVSFGGSEPEEDLDGGGTGGISTWHDINPQSTLKNNATSTSAINNPGYTQKSATTINGLPSLRFDGVNHYLNFDGSLLVGSDYSIFIVEQRNSAAAEYDYMVSGRSQTPATGNDLLQIGYRENAILTWGQFDNDYDITVAGYNSPIPRIHALVFSSTATSPKVYFINGARQTLINNGTPVASQPLVAYENANFGSYDGLGYYQGNIGEIIIFNRGLKNEERRSIEEYLGKKWKIEISN